MIFSDKHQYTKESYISPVKTRQEIANEFCISRRTLFSWLKKAQIELSKGFISPKAQKQIYDKFGYPPKKWKG